MFKFDLTEAFHYPFQGLGRFFVATVAMPVAITACAVTVFLVVILGSAWPDSRDLEAMVRLVLVSLAAIMVLVSVPVLVLLGYGLRATREVAHGAWELPAWSDWLGLLWEGLAASLVGIVLGLVPLALVLGLAGVAAAPYFAAQRPDPLTSLFLFFVSGLGILYALALVLLVLLIQLLMPMAMLRLAIHRSLLAALNPLGLISDILRAPWDYALYQVVLFGVGWLAHGLMSLLPVLLVLSLPLNVYLQLLSSNLLGQYWRNHVLRTPNEGRS